MSAPLLRERDSFLSKKQSEGNGLRSLQMTADQLLFATHHLSLTNDTVMVDLSNILAMQRDYDGPKSTFLVSTVVQWLENMGLLDQRFGDQSIMFNRFSSVCHYRMRYLAYPFYEERLSYLKDLESRGMSFRRLHEYAWMQLVIIDRLRLNRQDRIYESDVENVIKDRIAEDCSKGCIPSQKWIKTFRAGFLMRGSCIRNKNRSHWNIWLYTNTFFGLGTVRGWPSRHWMEGNGNSSASCHLFKARMICHPHLWNALTSICVIVITAVAAGALWRPSSRP